MEGTRRLCFVRGCNYPTTHVTLGHKCGTCFAFGHGQMECGNEAQQRSLFFGFCDDVMPDHEKCRVAGCSAPEMHATCAHHCACGRRGGGGPCCAVEVEETEGSARGVVMRTCPHCKQFGEVDLDFEVYTGSDCCVCYESRPLVVFRACRHAQVCVDCTRKL